MCPKKSFLFCVLLAMVSSENGSRKKSSKKSSRLFSFNTADDDISVNLEFSIPFISIPVKKALGSNFDVWSSGLPTININPAALLIGGAMVFGTTVLIPHLVKSFALQHHEEGYSRLLDSAEFSSDAVLDFTRHILADGRGVRSCALRVACWTAQRATNFDPIQLWNKVMSNSLLSSVINSTAIEDAMLSGRNGRDCTTYTPCPLRDEHVPMLLTNLDVFASSIR